MRKVKISLLLVLVTFCMCTNAAPKIRVVYDLIERVTPGYSDQFRLELIPSIDGKDCYEIGTAKGKVLLRGNNVVSLATAYNQYLKYTCHVHVSWVGNQLNLPSKLPLPAKHVKNTIQGKYRVYMNYCTFSYTAPWWDWERWQKELDYMAMNSINMPLAVVGLEAVWYNTLLKYGFTDEEIRKFLAGPAHSAWQWMQNLQSYGGPLPKSWIDKHVELGKKIMERQLAFGMQPIQQGFSGYVPREFKERFPDAKIRLQPSWLAFTGVASLDPTDPLFTKFGRSFLEEQKKLFGTYGAYAADPFHESDPPVDTPEYLNAVGVSINKLMKDFDPKAMWIMQSWSIREHIVEVVPKENLLILDLDGVKSQQEKAFWGYPFIAGNLHSFGGRVNLHGDLRLLASNQYAVAMKKSPNICGSGLFMEAIQQNPIYYDLAFEMPLHAGEVDIEEWIKAYAERRYGGKTENAEKAMKCLLEGPYRPGTNGTERSSIIAARPALNVKKSGPNDGLEIPYDPLLLIEAEEWLLKDAELFKNSESYRFDVIDVQRQLMSNLGQLIHKQAAVAFNRKDKQAFALHSGRFLALLHDVDVLLRTRSEYSLDKWLTDARKWGTNKEEQDLYERDASTLVTIWGADGDPMIFDYSWREWSGLIDGFYAKRWEKFYSMLADCLETGKDYSEEGLPEVYGRESFRANAFYDNLANWELNYASTTNKARRPITQGDEIEIAQKMFKKYAQLAEEYYQPTEGNENIKLDNSGEYINAHGGGVLAYDDKYYWFGEHRPINGFVTEVGVNCYSSVDLCNWKYEGVALAVSQESGSEIEEGCIMERPKVIYNKKTGKFVLWFHLELKGKGYEAARVGMAVSDTPTGPYHFVRSMRVNPGIYPLNMPEEERSTKWDWDKYKEWWTPEWRQAVKEGLFVQRDLKDGQMSRDMTLFVDDDGKAYHIYSSEENLTLQIAELTDDYQAHSGKYIRLFPGGHNEAPAIFKHDNTYWMIASGCTGWAPNEARMFSASSIWGPWTQHPHPFIGPGAEKTFGGQSTYVLSLPENKYIFMADVWKPDSLMYSRYIWLPIDFDKAGKPIIEWKNSWKPAF